MISKRYALAALAGLIFAGALAIVVVLTVVVSGPGRDEFGHGSVADLTKALQAQGLDICSAGAPDSGGGHSWFHRIRPFRSKLRIRTPN